MRTKRSETAVQYYRWFHHLRVPATTRAYMRSIGLEVLSLHSRNQSMRTKSSCLCAQQTNVFTERVTASWERCKRFLDQQHLGHVWCWLSSLELLSDRDDAANVFCYVLFVSSSRNLFPEGFGKHLYHAFLRILQDSEVCSLQAESRTMSITNVEETTLSIKWSTTTWCYGKSGTHASSCASTGTLATHIFNYRTIVDSKFFQTFICLFKRSSKFNKW